MTEKYTIKDVTKDIGFLLSLTKFLELDDDGFWYDPGENQRYLLRLDANDPGKQVAVFQDPLPKGDFYFFNPFAEGFGKKSPAVQQWYKALRIALNVDIHHVAMHVAREILRSKTEEGISLNHAIIRMSSASFNKKGVLFDVIDEKMIDEFETLFKRIDDEIIFVPYLNNQMIAKIKCDALTDGMWDEKYGNDIRKKSLPAFKSLLMGVLGVKEISDLESFSVKYDPDLKTSARMYTTLSVYLKLYSKFNDVLADAYAVDGTPSERDEVDLGELKEVIDRFGLAYAIAKHMIQPSLPKLSATETRTSDTSNSSFNTGGSRFPGPGRINEYGQEVRNTDGLSFGGQSKFDQPQSRFARHDIIPIKPDPFAPPSRETLNPSPFSGGGGFGGMSRMNGGAAGLFSDGRPSGFSGGSGGYFNSGLSFGGSGFDATPPNAFGHPSNRRNFF